MNSPMPAGELIARQLRRTSLSEQAAKVVRRMILTGELTPGRRVTQDEIALILGVSTMPVREALVRLAMRAW